MSSKDVVNASIVNQTGFFDNYTKMPTVLSNHKTGLVENNLNRSSIDDDGFESKNYTLGSVPNMY